MASTVVLRRMPGRRSRHRSNALRGCRRQHRRVALLRTLELLKAGEAANELLYGSTTGRSSTRQPTRGTRGSGARLGQLWRTWSREGSNEHAIVRMSPANALR
jgi:hypothetical protein